MFSQDYKKTVVEDREWTITIEHGMGSVSCLFYHISSDTLIGDKVYHKVESEHYEASRGLVREDTIEQKVYYWSNDSISERLVVDYQLEKGDTFDFGDGLVLAADSVYYNDSGAKIILFPPTRPYAFIEGIGHSFNGIIHDIQGWQRASITDTLNNPCQLPTTEEEIEETIKIGEAVKIYPNPTNIVVNIIILKQEITPLEYILVDLKGVIQDRGVLNISAQLNIDHLENGIYYLKLMNGNQAYIEKILVIE